MREPNELSGVCGDLRQEYVRALPLISDRARRGLRQSSLQDRDAAARLRTLVNAHAPVLVITGGARGADTITHNVALEIADEGLGVDTKVIDADWSVKDDTPFWAIRTTRNGRRYDLRAGNVRNGLMLDEGPEVVIAFADDLADAPGTADCLKQARARNACSMANARSSPRAGGR